MMIRKTTESLEAVHTHTHTHTHTSSLLIKNEIDNIKKIVIRPKI